MTSPLAGAFRARVWTRLARDPRHYQIAVLASLLIYGVSRLHFDVSFFSMTTILAVALATQFCFSRALSLAPFDPRSPLISGLSLCLLLRANDPGWLAAGAFVAIASKFLLCRRGKHLFNPTNFAIVGLLACTDQAWVSPGQWGSPAVAAFAVACLGGLVIHRAARSDVMLAFLLSFAVILFVRAAWLGDPWAIPLKQLQSGALLIFAFFMISDPKTTPDSRSGRILFAVLVAAGAGCVQFALYRNNGLLWSLALASLTIPLLDKWFPGKKYQWTGPRAGDRSEGEFHETHRTHRRRDVARPAVAGTAGA